MRRRRRTSRVRPNPRRKTRLVFLCFTAKKARIGKDPNAKTDFLPDPERDAKRLKEIEEKMYQEQREMERKKGSLQNAPPVR